MLLRDDSDKVSIMLKAAHGYPIAAICTGYADIQVINVKDSECGADEGLHAPSSRVVCKMMQALLLAEGELEFSVEMCAPRDTEVLMEAMKSESVVRCPTDSTLDELAAKNYRAKRWGFQILYTRKILKRPASISCTLAATTSQCNWVPTPSSLDGLPGVLSHTCARFIEACRSSTCGWATPARRVARNRNSNETWLQHARSSTV